MKFTDLHNRFFNTQTGAFSKVTEVEYDDSQVTATKDEYEIFLDFFGEENIHRGRVSDDREKSKKAFLLYPEMKPIELNLVFPKTNKNELRLYLSSRVGFKPKPGDYWLVYKNKEGQLVLGGFSEEEWNTIGKEINLYSFEPGAMSIIQMGEELIGHPSTAVNELVKNGYDADANHCKVYFHVDDNPDGSFAIIHDDGTGMDEKTLFGNWLQPSMSSKRYPNAKSEIYKRNLLGSKGIGRLAAMALGENITVVSKKKEEKEYNWITVSRGLFKEDKLLSEIKFPGHKIDNTTALFDEKFYYTRRGCLQNNELVDILMRNKINSFENGTLIVIEKLDNSVIKQLYTDFGQNTLFFDDKNEFINTAFYKSLSTLITPLKIGNDIQNELIDKGIIHRNKIPEAKGNIFDIQFYTNLIKDNDYPVINWVNVESISIQKTYDYRVYGKVDEAGNVNAFYSVRRIENEFIDEKLDLSRDEIYDDSLSGNKASDLFNQNNKNETGEYYFDIRVYDIGEKDNLEKLARQSNFESGAKFKSAFKNLQGLRVSKNNFGVKPYGEEVEDWIGLSKERVQNPGQNINTNQLIGYIYFFSPENDNLEEKTNREGFIENTAFMQVKATLATIFKNLGRKRYNYRLSFGLGRIPDSKHKRPDFDSFLEKIKSTRYVDDTIIDYSEKFMKEVNTSMDNLEDSLSFAERLASLGSGIELVYHEMAQPISGLKTTKSSLNLKRKKIDPDVLDFYINDINNMAHATEVLIELRQSLQPAIGRARKKSFSPYETFIKVVNLFRSDLDDHKITVAVDHRLKEFFIEDFEYAFWISFLNIVNNAVYWIKKSGREGEIRFYLNGEKLIVSNNGPLIRHDIIDHIFKYGVTARSEKNATGLGLAFTQSILSRNNWNIIAENSDFGPEFIISKSEDNE